MPDKTNFSNLTYEAAFQELETIVAELESNQRTLEEAMALFERGQALALHCAGLLDTAELKVQTLINEGLADLNATDEEE